jgi:hypothetical protein
LQRGEPGRAATLIAESLRLRWEFGDKWNIASVLEAAAAVMVATDRAEVAARIYGAIEALREAIDSPLMALDKPDYERNRAAAQATLGETAFIHGWTHGRRLPLATAVSGTLEILQAMSGNPSAAAVSASSAVNRSTID